MRVFYSQIIFTRRSNIFSRKDEAMEFNLLGYNYKFAHHNPNGRAEYGLALTFWKTNLKELEFTLKYVNTWHCREQIDISICSNWPCPQDLYQYCNYIVHCEKDLGHQDGTTLHCNGGIYPISNDRLWTITHTDADTIILNEQYFLGMIELSLMKTQLIISGPSYIYKKGGLAPHPELGPGSVTDKQFGSMFVMPYLVNYFPIVPRGNFESDRQSQFFEKFSKENVLILPRVEHQQGILKGFDFHLGVMHNANIGDSLDRFRKVMGVSV